MENIKDKPVFSADVTSVFQQQCLTSLSTTKIV
jgi:hypothetical protein